MPKQKQFQQFVEQCLPTLNARMNFNRQLYDSTCTLESNDEVLDYWNSIVPGFTKVVSITPGSSPQLETLVTFGKLAGGEAKYYQSIIDFLTLERIYSPSTPEEILNAVTELSIIYVKIMCKQHLLKQNEQDFKNQKIEELKNILRKSRKSPTSNPLGITKKDLSQFMRDFDEAYVESTYLAEIMDVFSSFLTRCSPVYAGLLNALTPSRVVNGAGDVAVMYQYDPSKILRPVYSALSEVKLFFQGNRTSFSLEQQREYYTLFIEISKNYAACLENNTQLSKEIFDPNNIVSTQKFSAAYIELYLLLPKINDLSQLLKEWLKQFQNEELKRKLTDFAEQRQQQAAVTINMMADESELSKKMTTLSLQAQKERIEIKPVQEILANEKQLAQMLSHSHNDETNQQDGSDSELYESELSEYWDGTFWQWEKSKRTGSFDSYLKKESLSKEALEAQKHFQSLAYNLRKHKELFHQLFTKDIHLKFTEDEIISVIEILGGKIENGSGSRKRIKLNHVYSDTLSPCETTPVSTVVIHSPHGRKARSRDKKLPSFCVKNYVNVLRQAGFTPDKLWPLEDFSSEKKSVLR